MTNQKDRRWKLFNSKQCGRCCIELGLPYDPNSIFEIADFLKLSVPQAIDKYYGKVLPDDKKWKPDDNKNGTLPEIMKDWFQRKNL